MTLLELTEYIRKEWDDIADPDHAAQLILPLLDNTNLDQLLSFYSRNY